MKRLVLWVMHLTSALVTSAVVCLLGLMTTVLLSVATHSPLCIPGLAQTTVGEGSELVSVDLLPATPAYFAAVALVVYAALVFTSRRHRLRRAARPTP